MSLPTIRSHRSAHPNQEAQAGIAWWGSWEPSGVYTEKVGRVLKKPWPEKEEIPVPEADVDSLAPEVGEGGNLDPGSGSGR